MRGPAIPIQLEAGAGGLSSTRQVCRRPLSDRDSALLLALHQYRYLDSDHVADLLREHRKKAQLRLRQLLRRGLVYRWPPDLRQGSPLTPITHVLTSAGAQHIARLQELDPRPIRERARRARQQMYHLRHDLEANRFFTKLAAAARDLPDQGLYHWVGEATCRAAYERQGSPPSDGWGRYLLPDREIAFDLEWDRGSEHARRIRTKASGYVSYFSGRRSAELHQALFVAPNRMREVELQKLIAPVLPSHVNLCRFWTSSLEAIASLSWLGAVWLEINGSPVRQAFAEMPGLPRTEDRVADCIAKPRWWKRRLSGGEGA